MLALVGVIIGGMALARSRRRVHAGNVVD